MSTNIIVPGAAPPQIERGVPAGSMQFDVNVDNGVVGMEPVYAKRGQAARDILVDNPAFQPFVVSVPFITSRLTIDPDLRHDIVFIRGAARDGVGTALGAVAWWDKLIGPRFHGPAAESGGAPVGVTMDEGDAAAMWRDAVRLHKSNPGKHPLVAIGDPEVPFFFCMPGEDYGHKHMHRFSNFDAGRRNRGVPLE